MLRSAAIASSAALKRALSASARPLILGRSIVTAPISSRLSILNLCYQAPRILFSPPPFSTPFGGASARGFATETTDDDSDADWSDEEIEDELLGSSESTDISDMSDDFDENEDD